MKVCEDCTLYSHSDVSQPSADERLTNSVLARLKADGLSDRQIGEMYDMTEQSVKKQRILAGILSRSGLRQKEDMSKEQKADMSKKPRAEATDSAKRKCLMCGKIFTSTGKGNRRCPTCRTGVCYEGLPDSWLRVE